MGTNASMDGRSATDRTPRGRHLAARPKRSLRALGTMPVHLVGSLVSRTGPVPDGATHSAGPRRARRVGKGQPPVPEAAPVRPSIAVLLHPVAVGESAADIAGRHGVSTASLLAANGLSWRSPLAPGIVLTVPTAPRPRPVAVAAVEPGRHRVADGETVRAIAAAHGVPTAAVLLANGLSRSSTIVPGQQLVIPDDPAGRTTSAECLVLTGEMRANARVIVDVGRRSGLPDAALVVALTAAMQDASLRNLDFGETVGVGLFHRRPAAAGRDRGQLLDPETAAETFFHGRDGSTGLIGLPGWTLMGSGEAASAVQAGGGAAAYAKWEDSARTWLADLGARGDDRGTPPWAGGSGGTRS